ncbi:unnamed protein product [Nezara viridula]|uniref:Uncharacterized protein n=1 Tax=Nezara viridula TaxID=85310 RepID=A0A9P0HDK0_NEZVI|nr:unnamed protein product [Nezara viridula]
MSKRYDGAISRISYMGGRCTLPAYQVALFRTPNIFLFIVSYLKNVSVEGEPGKPNIEFTADGALKAAELKIMNLRPGVSRQLVWEEVTLKT